MKSKGFAVLEVLLVVLALVILVVGVWIWRGQDILNSNSALTPTPYLTNNLPTKELSPYTTPTVTSRTSPTLAPTTNLTAGWETYISGDKVYSFKYPTNADWIFTKGNPPSDESPSVSCEQCEKGDNIDFFQVTPIIHKSLEEYINSRDNSSILDYQKTKLNGIDVVKVAEKGGPQWGGSSIKVFLVINNQGYEITMRYVGWRTFQSEKKSLDYKKITDYPAPKPDILSTFQLIK